MTALNLAENRPIISQTSSRLPLFWRGRLDFWICTKRKLVKVAILEEKLWLGIGPTVCRWESY